MEEVTEMEAAAEEEAEMEAAKGEEEVVKEGKDAEESEEEEEEEGEEEGVLTSWPVASLAVKEATKESACPPTSEARLSRSSPAPHACADETCASSCTAPACGAGASEVLTRRGGGGREGAGWSVCKGSRGVSGRRSGRARFGPGSSPCAASALRRRGQAAK